MNNRLSYGVLINGAGGKMGQALIRLIHQQPQLGLRVAATRNAAGPVTADFDIVLDFSTPQGAQEAFSLAQSHRKPFLTGTTNLRWYNKCNKKQKSRYFLRPMSV